MRKCPYCDFNSHQVPGSGVPEEAYLQALLDDLEHAAADCEGRPLISVFFGGGTPSLFSPSSPVPAAIGNALASLGAHVTELPMSAERVLEAL